MDIGPRISIPGGFAYIWQSEWVGITAIKTERTQIHFLSNVLVDVASLDLKVPNMRLTTGRAREFVKGISLSLIGNNYKTQIAAEHPNTFYIVTIRTIIHFFLRQKASNWIMGHNCVWTLLLFAHQLLLRRVFSFLPLALIQDFVLNLKISHLCIAVTAFRMNFLSSLSIPGTITKVPLPSEPPDTNRPGPPCWESPWWGVEG